MCIIAPTSCLTGFYLRSLPVHWLFITAVDCMLWFFTLAWYIPEVLHTSSHFHITLISFLEVCATVALTYPCSKDLSPHMSQNLNCKWRKVGWDLGTRVALRFLSALCPRGGKTRLYGSLGGQVCIYVQSMWQTRGVWGHAPLGNFDFGPFIRRIWDCFRTNIIYHLHVLCH